MLSNIYILQERWWGMKNIPVENITVLFTRNILNITKKLINIHQGIIQTECASTVFTRLVLFNFLHPQLRLLYEP